MSNLEHLDSSKRESLDVPSNGSVHTPGPWYVEGPDHEDSEGRTTGKWAIRAPCLPPRLCISYQLATLSGRDLARDEANARLIAAAPDLLAACNALIEAHKHQGLEAGMLLGCAHEMARAAIDKATGANQD